MGHMAAHRPTVVLNVGDLSYADLYMPNVCMCMWAIAWAEWSHFTPSLLCSDHHLSNARGCSDLQDTATAKTTNTYGSNHLR